MGVLQRCGHGGARLGRFRSTQLRGLGSILFCSRNTWLNPVCQHDLWFGTMRTIIIHFQYENHFLFNFEEMQISAGRGSNIDSPLHVFFNPIHRQCLLELPSFNTAGKSRTDERISEISLRKQKLFTFQRATVYVKKLTVSIMNSWLNDATFLLCAFAPCACTVQKYEARLFIGSQRLIMDPENCRLKKGSWSGLTFRRRTTSSSKQNLTRTPASFDADANAWASHPSRTKLTFWHRRNNFN